MSHYERTLFQVANVFRNQGDGSKYDERQTLVKIADNIKVGMAKKTGTQSSISEKPSHNEITEYFLMHTLFSDIKEGDTVEVQGFGSYVAGKPYPVMDRSGIHHYEVTLFERTDA